MNHKIRNIFLNGPVTPEKIATSIQSHSSKTEIGGHSIFLGQVRSDDRVQGKVSAIEYTAYEEMANKKAHEIRQYIFGKYPITCMHLYHSLGIVKAGEISLFAFTSAPHRKEAIDSCSELVELIKKELPIWGREIIDNGKMVWKTNK